MKRITLILCINLLALGIFAIPLRILHTNDTHGAYLPQSYSTEEGYITLGGYLNLWEHLEEQRQAAPRSIYLDAGDQQTGSAFAAMEYDGAIGGAVIKVFNHLQPDAATFGNHEFDQNPDNLERLIELAEYPFISSNIIDLNTNQPLGNKPWHIIQLDSLKIGVLGLTLVELPEKVRRSNVEHLQILPYKEAIDLYLDELHDSTDLIIVLTHNGIEADIQLALELDERIHLIIGGHTHSYIDEPLVVNGIHIAQAGSYLSHLGVIDLDVEDGIITSYSNRLVPLTSRPVSPDNPLNTFISQMSSRIEDELGQTIATLPEDWVIHKFGSTNLSRWMATALKTQYAETFSPDIAIVNNGGFRKNIPAGPVTLRDMHELLPFNNTVTVFSCYGRNLHTWAELNNRILAEKPFDICESSPSGWQGSGDEAVFDLGVQFYEPDKVYRVISHDFVAGQWDKYLGFEPFDIYDTGEPFLDAMVREIKAQYGIK